MSRLDVWDKVNGSATFGTDNFVPGMVYASIVRPPAYGARVTTQNREAAEKVAGVSHVVAMNRGFAVCATTFSASQKGKEALQVKWDKGPHSGLDNGALEKIYLQHLKQPGVTVRSEGDVKKGLAQAAHKIEATYNLPIWPTLPWSR